MKKSKRLIKRLAFKRRVKSKFSAWGKRFLLAEICGATLAVAASFCINYFFHNAVIAAYAGAVGDTIGFYTPIIIQDVTVLRKTLHNQNKKITFTPMLNVIKNMLLEFGPAEIIDSIFLRPFFMYYFPALIHNYPVGILVGKLAGDITFYIPVALSNRIRALHARKKG